MTGEAGADVAALRAVSQHAASLRDVPDEPEIATAVLASEAWTTEQRTHVRLLDAPVSAVDDILGRAGGGGLGPAWSDLPHVVVHVAGRDGRCVGLYVTGELPGSRSLNGREVGLQRLLAQATGEAGASLRAAPTRSRDRGVARWSEGETTVVGRWRSEELIELRIGEAQP